jgi:proteasome accessory factor C
MSGTRRQPDVMRMLTLVPWLIGRPGVSLAETAGAFATDEATIRAELEHLDFCGLPGLGGGALFDVTISGGCVTVRMADELRYPMRPTSAEALRLLLIATAAERVVGGDVPGLSSALGKLHTALGVPPGAIEVLDAEPDGAVMLARRAIAARVMLRFSYRGRSDEGPAVRRIEPWAIEFSEGAWYLHGFDVDADGGRVFRLERAAGFELTEEACTRPVPSELPAPVYVAAPDDLEVVLLLEPGAEWLLDAVRTDRTTVTTDGLRVEMRTGSPEWLARLVLMAAGGAVVLEPAELRERVRSRAEEALSGLI